MPKPDNRPPVPPAQSGPAMARLHIWQIQAVRDVMLVAAVIALIWAGYAMRAVTVPLLIALMFAYLFEPLVAKLTRPPAGVAVGNTGGPSGVGKPRISRPVVVGGLLLTVGLSLAVVLAIMIPLIVGQTVSLVDNIRHGRYQNTIHRLQELAPERYRNDVKRMVDWLEQGTTTDANAVRGAGQIEPSGAVDDEQRLRQIIRDEIAAADRSGALPSAVTQAPLLDVARSTARAVLSLLGTIVGWGLLAFLIPFYFFFFSVWYPHVVRFGRNLIPESNRPRALELIGRMDRAVAGFVRGRIVICVTTGVLLSIGWMIVGVPYAIVLGMVTGVFFAVPFLSAIGIPLAVGFLALEQLGLPEAERMVWWAIILKPAIVFAIVNVIETYALTPIIAGRATNLDPVTILVAVLAGGSVGGVYGMILAIPVAACLKILCTDVLLPRVRAWTAGQAEDPLPLSRQ